MTATLFFVALLLAVTYGFSTLALQIEKITRTDINGKKSYFVAEAGHEDVVYRLVRGKTVGNQEAVVLDGHTATTTVTTVSGSQIVASEGNVLKNIRSLETELISGTGVAFNYGLQAGEGGIFMENSSSVRGNVYSNGPITANNFPLIRGDAVSAGPSGLFEDHHATGTVYANTIRDSVVDEDAYYEFISGTTVLGTQYPGSSDTATSTLPISDDLIAEWEAVAEAGGTITSPCPYKIEDDAVIGPVKITCDLEIVGTGFTVTLNGMVWVTGNIKIQNSPMIKISSGLGNKSVVLIADNPTDRLTSSKVESDNSATFLGSGTSGSYVVLLSQNESAEQGGGETAITVANSASGDLLIYAGHGEILLQNNISLKEVTGYKIHTKNSAEIEYETGLANLLFASGPGGGYTILGWKEVE